MNNTQSEAANRNSILKPGEGEGFWIGAILTNTHYQDQPAILGKQCHTIEELEVVAEQIRDELSLVVAAARMKFP